MPQNLAGGFFATVELFLGPDVVDNRLNPVHTAVATSGYRIQSQLLHIPDRFGFFSSGPPRLQAHQGAFFAFVCVGLGLSSIWAMFALLLVKLSGKALSSSLLGAFAAMFVGAIGSFWAVACFDHHRAPGYDWGDLKRRTE